VKHPFDVGDRVTIYGNTGTLGRGDDYFVKEISLLFTEFKKMEGHVVQAPNSYLNTLFILNQRRSGGLAEAVPVTVKFGTTLEQIEGLRNRLLEFVTSENREYQKNILTELTTVYEAYSVTVNVVFFYKSNWQNELLRLQRRNKFICALMVTMQELGIEGPRVGSAPGANQDYPMFLQGSYPPPYQANPEPEQQQHDPGPRSGNLAREPSFVAPASDSNAFRPAGQSYRPHSILRNRGPSTSRQRGESLSQMGKRVDFSLGMQGISSGADFGDVYDKPPPRIPNPAYANLSNSPSHSRSSREGRRSEDGESLSRTFSRESQLGRITSASSIRTHRNRFLGRGRSKLGSAEEGTSLEDLEAGTREFNLGGMPDIPETPTTSSRVASSNLDDKTQEKGTGVGETRRSVDENQKLDPRTGLLSSQAVVDDSTSERGDIPMANIAGQATGNAPR
jgi:hypothetical protein